MGKYVSHIVNVNAASCHARSDRLDLYTLLYLPLGDLRYDAPRSSFEAEGKGYRPFFSTMTSSWACAPGGRGAGLYIAERMYSVHSRPHNMRGNVPHTFFPARSEYTGVATI
jgi:hypothetical protein